jgi:diguanylate cyclase (GGDEF)-like protein/PAS domain S-box-containing protein
MTQPEAEVRQGFFVPTEYRDEREADVARFSYVAIGVFLIGVTAFLPAAMALAPSASVREMIVGGIVYLMCAVAFVFVRTGHPASAARTIVFVTWAIAAEESFAWGGVYAPGMTLLLVPVVAAGVVLGLRDCIATGALSFATLVALVWERGARLIAPTPTPSPLMQALVVASAGAVITALVIASIRIRSSALDKLRKANDGLRLASEVYEVASEGIVIMGTDARIVDVNDAYCRMMRCKRDDVVGKDAAASWRASRHSAEIYKAVWDGLAENGEWHGEIWEERADGTLVPQWLSLSTVKDSEGRTTHHVGVFTDITTIKQNEQNLEWLGTHDSLTGLPNRSFLRAEIETVLARSRRSSSQAALLAIDVDDFKEINDNFGHAQGDQQLANVALGCMSVVRAGDTLGRMGGDEFLVVASGFSGRDKLGGLADRLLAAVRRGSLDGEGGPRVSSSIGIAVFPEDGEDQSSLMESADIAMDAAKARGGDRFEFFTPGMNEELRRSPGWMWGSHSADLD